MIKKLAGAIAAAFAMAGGAQAALVSYNSGPLVLEVADIFQNHSVQKFDSALGTLNAVTLEVGGRVVSSLTLTNVASQANRFGYQSTSNFSLTGTGGVNEIFQIPLWNFPITSVGVNETVDLGAVDFSDSLTFAVSNIGDFIGAGTADFTCETFTSQNILGGGGNVDNKQRTNAGCSVSVTYDYTAATVPPGNNVPEPGSLALIGVAGLAAAGAMRRRRK